MESHGKELSGNSLHDSKEEDGTASGVSSFCFNDVENMQMDMLEKARELFQLCDKEEKGFITKLDMQVSGGEQLMALSVGKCCTLFS